MGYKVEIEELDELSDILELTVRNYCVLKRAGITTIDQLEIATDEELLQVPNFNEKSLKEVREKLRANFLQIHFPTDPKILIQNGIEVPLSYLCTWHKTMGCNNWRKRNKLTMLRGQINNPRYCQQLTKTLCHPYIGDYVKT